MKMRYEIHTRRRRLVNTDPQKRCYNGCHFSSELQWSPWEHLESCSKENLEPRLEFWVELNDYAVSERGESARREFMVKEVKK